MKVDQADRARVELVLVGLMQETMNFHWLQFLLKPADGVTSAAYRQRKYITVLQTARIEYDAQAIETIPKVHHHPEEVEE